MSSQPLDKKKYHEFNMSTTRIGAYSEKVDKGDVNSKESKRGPLKKARGHTGTWASRLAWGKDKQHKNVSYSRRWQCNASLIGSRSKLKRER